MNRAWMPAATSLRGAAIIIGLIVLLALGLRLTTLSRDEYYDDEVISSFAAQPPVMTIFSGIPNYDTHPPGYHILLHYWQAVFGDDLLVLRLFSVTISVLCVPFVYLLGRELAGHAVGLVAALWMAIAPFQIYHAQQARMYPLLTLAVLLAALLYVRAWRRGGWRSWAALAVVATLGFYTHVYFAFSLLGLNLWALLEAIRARRIDRGRWAGLILSQLAAVLAFLPFVPNMLRITGAVTSGFWIRQITPFDWVYGLVSLSNNATYLNPFVPTLLVVFAYAVAGIALGLALFYSARMAIRRPDERSAILVLHLSLWTPIVVATTISLLIEPILLDRSLIGLSGPLFVLGAWMLLRGIKLHAVRLLAVILLASMLLSLGTYYARPPLHNDFQRIAGMLANDRRPGDAIAVADWQSFDTIVLLHPEMPDMYALTNPQSPIPAWQARMRFMGWHLPENVGSIPDFAPRYQRVWVVLSLYTYGIEHHEAINLSWLRRHGRLAETRTYSRATVYLYELGP